MAGGLSDLIVFCSFFQIHQKSESVLCVCTSSYIYFLQRHPPKTVSSCHLVKPIPNSLGGEPNAPCCLSNYTQKISLPPNQPSRICSHDRLMDLVVVKQEITTCQNKTYQAIFSFWSLSLVRLFIVPNNTLLFWRKDLQSISLVLQILLRMVRVKLWLQQMQQMRNQHRNQLIRVFFILEIAPRILHLFMIRGWR